MAPLRSAWLNVVPLRRRALLALLALLLLQAQGLGLWHRVAHGGLPVATAAAGYVHDEAHRAAHGVFGHDAGDESGCRLFDSLTAADALLAAPALPAATPQPPLADAAVPSHRAVRASRLYQARAPPQA